MTKAIVILSLVLLSVSDFAQAAQMPAPRPNVVILLTDDQGMLDANCYGSTDLKTPNMDRLAAAGTRTPSSKAASVCRRSSAIRQNSPEARRAIKS